MCSRPSWLNKLGEAGYGVWLLVMAFFSYYTLLDLGMNLAGVRFLARAIGKAEGLVNAPTSWRPAGDVSPYRLNLDSADSSRARVLRSLLRGSGGGVLRAMGDRDLRVSIALRFWLMVYPVVLKAHVNYAPIAASSVVRTVLQRRYRFGRYTRGTGSSP